MKHLISAVLVCCAIYLAALWLQNIAAGMYLATARQDEIQSHSPSIVDLNATTYGSGIVPIYEFDYYKFEPK